MTQWSLQNEHLCPICRGRKTHAGAPRGGAVDEEEPCPRGERSQGVAERGKGLGGGGEGEAGGGGCGQAAAGGSPGRRNEKGGGNRGLIFAQTRSKQSAAKIVGAYFARILVSEQ